MIDALKRANVGSGQVGVDAVEVRALNEGARRSYLKYGFTPLTGRLDASLHLDEHDP
ncbi:MAG TPA: hypothetical protein VEZ90_11040 [Blastocatellia bacterium]|nr:hypothetical protein [Blastocatellia bacterium]